MRYDLSSKSLFQAIGVVAAVGVIALPMYAGAATTTVSSSLGSVITLFTTNGTVTLNSTPTAGGVQTIASDTVTVSTNDAAGYTLKVGETTAASALTSGGNTIPAIGGTLASPIAETVNTWGYRVDSAGGFAAIGAIKFAAIPASGSPDTIKTTSSTATNDTTSVWYGLAVNTTQPTGSYTNSVTYTAIAN
jgi:hypothetical protein